MLLLGREDADRWRWKYQKDGWWWS